MRRKIFAFSLLSIFTVVGIFAMIILFNKGATATTIPLSQSEIESKALVHAHKFGLQDAPTSILSKQMSISEYNARLDPFSKDNIKVDSQVWLVILKGKVIVTGAPNASGTTSGINYDNMWILLNTDGEVKGWGTRPDSKPLDLSVPPQPISAWPTLSSPKK